MLTNYTNLQLFYDLKRRRHNPLSDKVEEIFLVNNIF